MKNADLAGIAIPMSDTFAIIKHAKCVKNREASRSETSALTL
jgi:hypothetical protein